MSISLCILCVLLLQAVRARPLTETVRAAVDGDYYVSPTKTLLIQRAVTATNPFNTAAPVSISAGPTSTDALSSTTSSDPFFTYPTPTFPYPSFSYPYSYSFPDPYSYSYPSFSDPYSYSYPSYSYPTFSYSIPSYSFPTYSYPVPTYNPGTFAPPSSGGSSFSTSTRRRTNVRTIIGSVVGPVLGFFSLLGGIWLAIKRRARRALGNPVESNEEAKPSMAAVNGPPSLPYKPHPPQVHRPEPYVPTSY